MHNIKIRIINLWLCLCFFSIANAQKKNALFIAIDDYGATACDESAKDASGRKVCNLYGCKNDAKAMQGIIKTKFRFDAGNISTLYDQAASRANIFKAINNLIAKSNSGDIALLFYAGHGSQVRNSKSNTTRELDRLDESIIPADTKKKGILDIRDKELAALFNKFLDKGVHLTVIFDCCHSASISRGEQYDTLVGRYAPTQTMDIKDPASPAIPENRTNTRGSFLALSAAQSDQIAQELVDGNRVHHGAFTSALITALNQLSVNSSVTDIMKTVKGILLNNGKTNQDPAIAAPVKRQQQTLFGITRGKLSDRVLIPVSAIKNGKVEFLAGYAQGIQEGNELTVASSNAGMARVKVRISAVDGINHSIGQVIAGSIGAVKPGVLFEVTNWVSPKSPLLSLAILPNQFSYEQAEAIKQKAVRIKQSGKVNFITDLSVADPYLTIFYMNNLCHISIAGAGIKQILDPTPDIIGSLSNGKPVYFNLPAPSDACDAIRKRFEKKNFVFTNNPIQAQYMLSGILNPDDNMAYCWRAVGLTSKDALSELPVQTGHIALKNSGTDAYNRFSTTLAEYAMRLAKVKYWLSLQGPKNYASAFPYQLEFVRQSDKRNVGATGARVGDVVELSLKLTTNTSEVKKLKDKFVYVFSMDKSGNMQLWYPDENAVNINNKFPKYKEFNSWNEPYTVIPLQTLQVGEPIGLDHYFVIASEQPISDPGNLFNQSGVSANKRGSNDDNPLAELLDMESESVSGRGGGTTTGNTWNLGKYALKVRK